VRIDFDAAGAREIADIRAIKAVVSLAFNQRRKQIGSVIHRKNATFEAEDFLAALATADINRSLRAEEISPLQFRALANALAGKISSGLADQANDSLEG
jgi:16S rRNA A1518/A1519 N6-dimethyltransferase RsmA/KsgA/DIM1 with predicted DNA glycosylase/AP lyase activity